MRDWNTEEGHLPNLNDEISALTQPPIGQILDESLWSALMMGAEAETRANLWFHSGNN